MEPAFSSDSAKRDDEDIPPAVLAQHIISEASSLEDYIVRDGGLKTLAGALDRDEDYTLEELEKVFYAKDDMDYEPNQALAGSSTASNDTLNAAVGPPKSERKAVSMSERYRAWDIL